MGVNSCGTTLIDNGAFKNIGAISWDTTAKTSGFTGVAGNGYFVNTTSGSITVTLPSSPSAGDAIGIADYANTADTNKIVINPNGNKIQGSTSNFDLENEGGSIVLVYVDATQGWLSIDSAVASDIFAPQFVTATGGTVTTSGDFKIHTFTGPGTFCVSDAGGPSGSNTVDYLVIAGGGGGSNGGGGAGGYRESSGAASGCYSRSPLGACVSALPVSVQGYPITVGAGGGGSGCTSNPGSNSIFSSITSTGGGGQDDTAPDREGDAGGSGGGGGGNRNNCGGAGNTPPVSPPQGNNGGAGQSPGPSFVGGGGGGGATAAGTPGMPGNTGNGGAGATSSINATPTARGGGGGGAGDNRSPAWPGGTGGSGGGGTGGTPDSGGNTSGTNGSANTGGGGGGKGVGSITSGGSGIVIIRYKYQ